MFRLGTLNTKAKKEASGKFSRQGRQQRGHLRIANSADNDNRGDPARGESEARRTELQHAKDAEVDPGHGCPKQERPNAELPTDACVGLLVIRGQCFVLWEHDLASLQASCE